MPIQITPDSATFDTWREYVEYGTLGRTEGRGWFPDGSYGTDSVQTDMPIGGTNTIEEAVDRAYSWPEGADMLAEMTQKVESESTLLPATMRKTKVVLQDKRPGPIHMGRLIAGHPAHMAIRQNRRAGEKILRVEVPGSYAYNVRERTVLEYASHVLAWINAVERAGIKVDLWLVQKNSGAGVKKVRRTDRQGRNFWDRQVVPRQTIRVRVKRSDAPLNMARIAFAVASPASLRRIGFGVMEHWCKDNKYQVADGYAYPGDIGRSVPGTVRTPGIGGWGNYQQEIAAAFRVGLGLNADGTEK